jgi:hypothetical protein
MTDLSTAYGVNYTKYYNIVTAGTGGLADFIDGANQWGTKLRVMYDTYTVATGYTLHTDCTLSMGIIPKGAIILGWYFAQSGGGEACVGTMELGTTAVSAASALTDMTNATQQFIPALSTCSDGATTSAQVMNIGLATADIDAATVIVLATFYILED